MDHPSTPFRRFPMKLLWILLFSMVLKLTFMGLIFSMAPSSIITSDSELYHNSALSLLQSGAFNISPTDPVPQTYVLPGYSVFLAGIYMLAGENNAAVIFVQVILSLAVIYLTYWIAAQIWDERTGLLAALLLSLDVTSLAFVLMVLTETLFAFLLLLALACAVKLTAHDSQMFKWAFLTGLFFAFATLVRPISYYLIVPVAIGVTIYYFMRHIPVKNILRALAVLTLPYLLLIGGWRVRNYQLTGNSEYNQLAGMNMLFYKAAGLLAMRDGIDLYTAQYKYIGMDIYQAAGMAIKHPEENLSEEWQRQAMQIFMENPGWLLRMQASSMFTIMAGSGETTLLQLIGYPIGKTGPLGDLLRLTPSEYIQSWVMERPLAVFSFVLAYLYLGLVYLATLYWVWRQVRLWTWPVVHLFLWGVFLYFLILSAGPEGYYRFRVPVMPILTVYAAAGIVQFMANRRSRRPAVHNETQAEDDVEP